MMKSKHFISTCFYTILLILLIVTVVHPETITGWDIALSLGLLTLSIIYTYRLESGRKENVNQELLEALEDLVKVNEDWNESVSQIIKRDPLWNDSYLNKAREAINKARE